MSWRRRFPRRGIALTRATVAGLLVAGVLAAPLMRPGSAAGQGSEPKVENGPGSEKRVALVIGNAAYRVAPLNNPLNDARAMTRLLESLGFEVLGGADLDLVGMRRALADFGERMAEGGVGLFYFSGHGLQVGGRNFLVPVNARLTSERYIAAETVEVDAVLKEMDAARNRLNVVVLDACRDNPFARGWRSAARGLGQMSGPPGTLIAYATDPGDVAADGEPGTQGVYTGELLRALPVPSITIEEAFKRAAQGVITRTRGRQRPWISSSFTGSFSFVPPRRDDETGAPVRPGPVPPVAAGRPAGSRPVSPSGAASASQASTGSRPPGDREVGSLVLDVKPLAPTTPAGPRPVAPAPAVAAIPRADVRIESSPPGATVYWDARDLGKTPVEVPGATPGRHHLVLVLDGHQTLSETVDVLAGQPLQVARTLSELAGSLEIVTKPSGARLELDGVPIGSSPQKLGRVRIGPHRLVVSHPDYQPSERDISVDFDQLARVEVELAARPGRLVITSTPQAEVFLGSRKLGQTVWAGEVPAGKHRIRIAREGYEERVVDLDLGPNEGRTIDAVLKKWDLGEMVLVPAGEFWMGGDDGDPDEKPRHRVVLDAFYIDKYEVTNAHYRAFLAGRGHERQELWSANGWQWRTSMGVTQPESWADPKFNDPRQPVVGVSWYQAEAYCRFAGKRLPTEAEWEKAARGTDGRKYPWGDAWDPNLANSSERGPGRPVAVGSYPRGASPSGTQDMAGNV